MVLNNNKSRLPTEQGSLKDPKEWNRVLMQYGGVFKNNIKEYAEALPKMKKSIKNMAR